MTTTLPLNTQAQAMFKDIVRQQGSLPAAIDQAVIQAAAPKADGTIVALDCDQLEKILLQAMPNQKKSIDQAKTCGLGYHPDKTNGRFLTQILSMRIEKETEHAYSPPRPVAPRVVDPLYASFTMAPDADVMLLFNARDVDAKGQPLLMKVVARERADVTKLDLARYRTQDGNTPDVVKIQNGASYVETKDIHETEFSFGDPLKQVSLNSKGGEISTSVWVRPENIDKQSYFRTGANGQIDRNRPEARFNRVTNGDNLDTTPVKTFDDRVRLQMTTADLPAGAWLDTANVGNAVKANLHVERGFMYEPGSQATVNLSGNASAELKPTVDKNDAHLLGNAPLEAAVTISPAANLRQILGARVRVDSQAQANGSDRAQSAKTLSSFVFADAATREVAGTVLSPLTDKTVAAAGLAAAKMACTIKPLPRDPEEDGVRLSLTLGEGFLSAAKDQDATFKGWKMVVGFTDVDGSWKEEVRTVKTKASKEEGITLDLNDFDGLQKANGNLEIRVFTDDGVPAQRVLVPFREVQWG